MNDKNLYQLNLTIPGHYRLLLRKIAAEQNYRNPFSVASATSVGNDIFNKAMRQIEENRAKEAGLALWEEDNHD